MGLRSTARQPITVTSDCHLQNSIASQTNEEQGRLGRNLATNEPIGTTVTKYGRYSRPRGGGQSRCSKDLDGLLVDITDGSRIIWRSSDMMRVYPATGNSCRRRRLSGTPLRIYLRLPNMLTHFRRPEGGGVNTLSANDR